MCSCFCILYEVILFNFLTYVLICIFYSRYTAIIIKEYTFLLKRPVYYLKKGGFI